MTSAAATSICCRTARAVDAGKKAQTPVTYCVFDLLEEGGKDLTGLSLLKRKARMMKRMAGLPFILPMSHVDAEHGEQVFEMAKQLKLEGLVAKRPDSVYLPGVRSSDRVR